MKLLTEAQIVGFRMMPPNQRPTSPEDELLTPDRALAKKQRDTRRAIETLLEERRLKAQLEM